MTEGSVGERGLSHLGYIPAPTTEKNFFNTGPQGMKIISILPFLGENCNLNWRLEGEGAPVLLAMPAQSRVRSNFQEMKLRENKGMGDHSNN